MKLNKHKLKIKGWTEKEIEDAEKILIKSEERRHPKLILLEKFSYWLLFGLIILFGLITAWIIQPILILTSNIISIIVVAIAGLLFSGVSIVLLRNIERLEFKHHVTISVIIPLTAIISSVFLINTMNIVAERTDLYTHNAYLLGMIFVVFSFIPYAVYLILEKRKK